MSCIEKVQHSNKPDVGITLIKEKSKRGNNLTLSKSETRVSTSAEHVRKFMNMSDIEKISYSKRNSFEETK